MERTNWTVTCDINAGEYQSHHSITAEKLQRVYSEPWDAGTWEHCILADGVEVFLADPIVEITPEPNVEPLLFNRP